MSANLELKKQIVSEIVENFKASNSIVFVDYRGITVEQDTKLRKALRENDVQYKVYKNRLMVKALEQMGITGYDPKNFEGTTAVLFSKDETAPARIFNDAMKDYNKMDFKFGILDGAVISKERVVELAKLPSKDVLIAMLLGMLQAPMSAFARALNAISEKKN